MGRRRTTKYLTPEDEYIYSPEAISTLELSKKWKGTPRCSKANLEKRCRVEGWVKQRTELWSGIRKRMAEKATVEIAEKLKDSVMEANERHREQGQYLVAVGRKLLARFGTGPLNEGDADPMDDIRPGEALRIASRASKDGVDIERKALGLADRVVKVQFAKEVAREFVEIVAKYVTDPDALENIGKDVDSIVEREREFLEEEMGEEAHILH